MRKIPITGYIILGILGAILASFGAQALSAMNDFMIQVGWCAQGNAGCLLLHYGYIAAFLIAAGLLIDGIVLIREKGIVVTAQENSLEDRVEIEITNGYDEDFTDMRLELKRLTIIGHRLDAFIRDINPFFLSGKRNDGDKIRPRDTATIYIAEITKGHEPVFRIDFLTDPVWRGHFMFRDISENSEGKRRRVGEMAGVIYEFVIEISGKIANRYITPQVYKGSIHYIAVEEKDGSPGRPAGEWAHGIHWMDFGKYSIKKETKRSTYRPNDEIINPARPHDDFWRLLFKMSPKRNRKTKKQWTVRWKKKTSK